MLANFLRPAGPLKRRNYGVALHKGGNAVRFVVPPLREVQQKKYFRRRALFSGLEAALNLKLLWDSTSKSFEIKTASMQLLS